MKGMGIRMKAENKGRKKAELLAPAGSEEAFFGAIHAGADAVYLGGSRFGARAYADNFTEEQLLRCIRYAHLFERKVYLTVNTLVKESEFSELFPYLLPLYEAGLDGVIVQDFGVLAYIREHFPGMELHISTQMAVTGRYGAALAKSMGASRVVPARELSLRELVEIKRATGLETEVFVHGAMCYCYSGQCLFSSILGGRSGNRGRCAQPCRLPYTPEGRTGEIYPLSLKDMCTIELLPKLLEAGIDSLKIEGRMKKPEYAAGVTAIYRKYIDAYYEGTGDFRVAGEDLEALSSLYIRSERQEGYFFRRNGREMITLHNPSYGGADESLLSEIRERHLRDPLLLKTDITACFLTGRPASVTLSTGRFCASAEGDTVQEALRTPITRENIEKQLKKLGDSVFTAGQIQTEVSDDAFYPLKQINELRRKAVALLEKQILAKNGSFPGRQPKQERHPAKERQTPAAEDAAFSHPPASEAQYAVALRTAAQLRTVLKHGLQPVRIYIDGDMLFEKPQRDREDILKLCRRASAKSEILIATPYILRSGDTCYLNGLLEIVEKNPEIFSGFLVRCMEGLGFLKDKSYSGAVYADAGLYVWNRTALWELVHAGGIAGFCMPLELTGSEQRELSGRFPCEKIVYGRIPMMQTANCIAKTSGHCRRLGKETPASGELLTLTDRYGTKFPVLLSCAHCMNIIYNSVPLSLKKELPGWKGKCVFRLDFTIEQEDEICGILDYFSNKTEKSPFPSHTTGHEKRGVL